MNEINSDSPLDDGDPESSKKFDQMIKNSPNNINDERREDLINQESITSDCENVDCDGTNEIIVNSTKNENIANSKLDVSDISLDELIDNSPLDESNFVNKVDFCSNSDADSELLLNKDLMTETHESNSIVEFNDLKMDVEDAVGPDSSKAEDVCAISENISLLETSVNSSETNGLESVNLLSHEASGLDEKMLDFTNMLESKNESVEIEDGQKDSIENCLEGDHLNESALLDDSFNEFNVGIDSSVQQSTSTFSAKDIGSKFSSMFSNMNDQVSHLKTDANPVASTAEGGQKMSVFQRIREVANSVNAEKVNENLNENLKQVYRNVLKNVNSDKFTGQNLLNKLNAEASTKQKSSESINSREGELINNSSLVSNSINEPTKPRGKEVIHVNLKEYFYFEEEENRNSSSGSKMATRPDSSHSMNTLSKTISLQEIPRESPAILRKNILDSRYLQSNDEINKMTSPSFNEDLGSSDEDILSVQNSPNDEGSYQLSDELMSFISMERCELMGLNKDELVENVSAMQSNWQSVLKSNKNLSYEMERLRANSSHQMCQTQIGALENQIQQMQNDFTTKSYEHQNALQKQMSESLNIRADLADRLEVLSRQYQEAKANKESMVIKYAMAEKNVLVAQKQRDSFEKKSKELEKDKDVLLARVKNISNEKARFMQILDKKLSECSGLTRELEKTKEEVNSRDVKLKWNQQKLKTEMDNLKSTQEKLDAAQASIANHEAEMAAVREEAVQKVRSTLSDEENRANVLDKQVVEQKSKLIVETTSAKQLKEELQLSKASLSSLTSDHASATSELLQLRQKLSEASAERVESETLFRSLQKELQGVQSTNTSLKLKLEHSEVLAAQLDERERELESCRASLTSERSSLKSLTEEMHQLRQREAEMLQLTQKLSETNSKVQSDLNVLEEEHKANNEERKTLLEEVEMLRQSRSEMKSKLTGELSESRTRLEVVCKELQHQTEATGKLLEKVSELESEITLMKKRHANAIKDMSRELQKMRRQTQQTVTQSNLSAGGVSANGNMSPQPSAMSVSPSACSPSNSDVISPNSSEGGVLSETSRTSSNMSLNNNGGNHQPEVIATESIERSELLAQRVIKLQKTLAKKQDKEEFLEEHVNQLVGELQKKNKIIDYFVTKEKPGVMTRGKDDVNKAKMMQQKGIMSSIYASQTKDDTMTLELSLEINKKLQALFEDTLLKNITLKDSLNTLGDEVARLSMANTSRR